MIRATALFYPKGGDLIHGMVTKTFVDMTPDEARHTMTKEVSCYLETGPLAGSDMVVQAAEIYDVTEEMGDEVPVFTKKAG